MIRLLYTIAMLDTLALQNVTKYIDRMDIIAPQCYVLYEGEISGEPDPKLIEIINNNNKNIPKNKHVKVMPLIINKGFNQEDFHKFLYDPEKIKPVIAQIVKLCQDNNYYGIQFDFENISVKDRDLYTAFCRETAKALHDKGYKFSVAIVGRLYDDYYKDPNVDKYQLWGFENWSGVYDQKELGEISDFVSIMAYDQHTRNTPPGPIAGLPWVKQILSVALKSISPEKLSLGIPFYSGLWLSSVDDKNVPVLLRRGLNYDEVKALISSKAIKLIWDDTNKVYHGDFVKDFVNEYLFVEEHDSLEVKLNIIKEYGLHGFSAWRVGFEDTRFYDLLDSVELSGNSIGHEN
ncbi:MAG: hypothetical protein LN569_01635 [Rickettsia endosymbiont of Labidopullus appendiculatus]|nr:hypothetical protein [Rickettsia endosymbiont of Labidopullus appendiculatus]